MQQQQSAKGAGRKGGANRKRNGGNAANKCLRGARGSGAKGSGLLRGQKDINHQLTHAAESGDLTELLNIIDTAVPSMSGINMATALHRVAKLSARESDNISKLTQHPTVKKLLAQISSHVGERPDDQDETSVGAPKVQPTPVNGQMPVQCMSIVAWSLATLQIRDEELFGRIAAITSSRLDELKQFELTNLAWAYSKISPYIKNTALFAAITERILKRRQGEYKVQSLACVLSAVAGTGHYKERDGHLLFSNLEDDVLMGATELKPSDLSGVLWAYATVGALPPRLFQALGDACCQGAMLCAFKPQELSRTLWSFAAGGLFHKDLFQRAESVALDSCRDLATQDIADVLWAYARNGVTTGSVLFASLLDFSARRLGQHSPEELSALVWAAGRVCPERVDFFEEVAQHCESRKDELTQSMLATLGKTFVAVLPVCPELFALAAQGGSVEVGTAADTAHSSSDRSEVCKGSKRRSPSQRSVGSTVSTASFDGSRNESETGRNEVPRWTTEVDTPDRSRRGSKMDVSSWYPQPSSQTSSWSTICSASDRMLSEPVVVFEDKMVVQLTVGGVDYHLMMAVMPVRFAFEDAVKKQIATACGMGIDPDNVSLQMSSGSVIVKATIAAPTLCDASKDMYDVGDRVQAMHSDGIWKFATVSSVLLHGYFELDWDDQDSWERVKSTSELMCLPKPLAELRQEVADCLSHTAHLLAAAVTAAVVALPRIDAVAEVGNGPVRVYRVSWNVGENGEVIADAPGVIEGTNPQGGCRRRARTDLLPPSAGSPLRVPVPMPLPLICSPHLSPSCMPSLAPPMPPPGLCLRQRAVTLPIGNGLSAIRASCLSEDASAGPQKLDVGLLTAMGPSDRIAGEEGLAIALRMPNGADAPIC